MSESRDAGFSLVESLVAVVLLGIAVVVLVGAMGSAARTSSLTAGQADSDLALRSAAELVKSRVYVPCALPAEYIVSDLDTAAGTTIAVSSVEHWNGSAFVASCPVGDPAGFQRVTLTSTSTGGDVTRTLQLIKRSTT